ncbi:MAG: enoyl-CoA hydratase/isomerase family protein [Actinobacteria bacterium]|nr:enoyl-CoA hydratase/isomerase family protein [Actinomycetota bacterium]
MTYQCIEYDVEHPLATITLNRPASMNSLTRELMAEVTEVLRLAREDDGVRVVILRGAGRCFSAGYDLGEDEDWGERSTHEVVELMQWYMEWQRGFWSFPKPLVASVHGYALAGACEIAMLCDLTIAARGTRLGEPEVRFSTGPPLLIMPWVVGLKAAKELLYTGKLIDADRAYQLGMVNEVCEPEDLERRTRYHALLIAKVSPLAVRLQKEAINRTFEIMGVHNAWAFNVKLTGILDGAETEEMRTFYAIQRERGLRAALDWRDEQFREIEANG